MRVRVCEFGQDEGSGWSQRELGIGWMGLRETSVSTPQSWPQPMFPGHSIVCWDAFSTKSGPQPQILPPGLTQTHACTDPRAERDPHQDGHYRKMKALYFPEETLARAMGTREMTAEKSTEDQENGFPIAQRGAEGWRWTWRKGVWNLLTLLIAVQG